MKWSVSCGLLMSIVMIAASVMAEETTDEIKEAYIEDGFTWKKFDGWKTYQINEYERGRIVYLGVNEG